MAEILNWPGNLLPASLSIQLLSNSKTFISPFTGSAQTARFPGSRWRFSLSFSNLESAEARQLEALVARLDGQSGRVRLWDFARRGVQGVGAPVVSADGQLGSRLATSGWAKGRQVLAAGDYLTVGGELKRVLEPVVADGNGAALVLISPMLRAAPTRGEAIEVAHPFGVFRLLDNEQGRFERRPADLTDVTLEFEEALN